MASQFKEKESGAPKIVTSLLISGAPAFPFDVFFPVQHYKDELNC